MTSAHRKRLFCILTAAAVLAAAIYYYRVDPNSSTGFMPVCWWRVLTGTQCPACGLQRALHAALHGHFLQALHYNYFFIISIPFLLALAVCQLFFTRESRLYRLTHHHLLLNAFVILFFAWWVVRNLLHI